MSKFGDSFLGRLGHIGGNWAGYSIFGDKGADARRHIIQDARADAIREREASDSRNKENAYLNSVDAAVLRNVDSVIANEFSDNPKELTKQLMDLVIQLKTNSFKAHNKEEKIRTKYSKAVLTKLEQGIAYLEYIDPKNSNLNYITWQYLRAKWRKIFSIRIGFSEDSKPIVWCICIMAVLLAFIFFMGWIEKNDTEDIILAIVGLVGIILLLIAVKYCILGFCMHIHNNRKQKHIRRIQQENAASQADENRKMQEEKETLRAEEERQKAYETKRNAEEQQKKEAENKRILEEQSRARDEQTATTSALKEKEVQESRKKEEVEAMLPRIQRKYNALWEKWGDRHPILKRGYKISICDGHKDILILGFNCQNTSISVSETYKFPIVEDYVGERIKRMLISNANNLIDKSTYLDLFGFKEEYHAAGMQNIVCNPDVFGYVASQISLTQDIIEDIIIPKLIIVLHKDIWAFLGKVKGFTWMGYTYLTIKSINSFELCEITGFSHAKDRISKENRPTTNLMGTKVLFADGVIADKYPLPEEILEML